MILEVDLNNIRSKIMKQLTAAEINEIVELYKNGMPPKEIGEKFGILNNSVNRIIRNLNIPTKTKKLKKTPVELGIPDSVLRYILAQRSTLKNPTVYLFPSLGGKKTGSGGGLSNHFGRLMIKAGIEVTEGEKKTGKGRTFRKKGFHSLRHTMISRMTEAGIPHELGMAISVHSNKQVHARYVQFTTEVRNSVFKRMPDFLSETTHEIEYYI